MQELAELGPDVLGADRALALREEEVARLVDRRLAPVDEERRVAHRRGVELARRRDARADGVDVHAGLQPRALEDRLCGRRRRADDVGVSHRLPPPSVRLSIPSSLPPACGCRRRRARSRAPPASPRDASAPGCPAPRIASVRTSSRASSRVATPETAAVRTAVIAAGVQQRARLTGLAVEERDEALVRVEAARAVAGEDRDRLQPPERRVAAAMRRHQPHQARLARRPDDEAERVVHLAARERARARRPSPRCTPPSAAAAARRARRGPAPSCEERAYALAVGRRERERRAPARTGSRCSARFGPHTAPSHAMRAPRRRRAPPSRRRAPSASSRSRSSPSKTASSTRRSYGSGRSVIREPAGNGSPRRYLPVSQPPAERPERDVRDPVRRAERQHLVPRRRGRAASTGSGRARASRAGAPRRARRAS